MIVYADASFPLWARVVITLGGVLLLGLLVWRFVHR